MKKFLLIIRPENTEEQTQKYVDAIEKFGGKVVCVDDNDSWDKILGILTDVDGILLPGGNDVGKLDYLLIEYAISNKIKLLGICQGMQSMAMYGSDDKLISIGSETHYLKDKYCHMVQLEEGSDLANIIGKTMIKVNSYHYQTVSKSHYFKTVGKSEDGLLEAIERNDGIFQIGVQWHPERMLEYDTDSFKIIESFINC